MRIRQAIEQSIEVKQTILQTPSLIETIDKVAKRIVEAYSKGNKVLFCGNGGSAADAQHLAAELSGRFYYDRPPLYAEALHVNSSYLTAVANDYSFEDVFSRMIDASGREGDVLIGISTSGNSGNIVKAMETAHKKNMFCVALTGKSGGKMKELSDLLINIPSVDTPRIQESHILVGHIICEIVESTLFPKF